MLLEDVKLQLFSNGYTVQRIFYSWLRKNKMFHIALQTLDENKIWRMQSELARL